MWGALLIGSGIIVGMMLWALCAFLFGDSPIARFVKLVASVVGGFAYVVLMIAVNDYAIVVADWLAVVILFGPAAIFVILLILNYMFK